MRGYIFSILLMFSAHLLADDTDLSQYSWLINNQIKTCENINDKNSIHRYSPAFLVNEFGCEVSEKNKKGLIVLSCKNIGFNNNLIFTNNEKLCKRVVSILVKKNSEPRKLSIEAENIVDIVAVIALLEEGIKYASKKCDVEINIPSHVISSIKEITKDKTGISYSRIVDEFSNYENEKSSIHALLDKQIKPGVPCADNLVKEWRAYMLKEINDQIQILKKSDRATDLASYLMQ